jgi:4-carboxymuconolactone decarboxylase
MKTLLRAGAVCLLAGSALAQNAERLPEIPLDKMTPEQRAVAEAILAGPRKEIGEPFNAWLRDPELTERLGKLGEYFLLKTSLDGRVRELTILMTAQFWRSQYEWFAHAPMAIKTGLDPETIAAIGSGRKPDHLKEDEAIAWEFNTQLRRDHSVDDAIYARAIEKFGERGVVDLIALNGAYDIVSMTINVKRVPVPADAQMPFKQAGP